MGIYTKIIDQQKLMTSWKKVLANRPACGVDHMTWEEFERNCKLEIRQLNLELFNHTYSVQPVRLIHVFKDEKEREISLYTIRDKVVQVSIANELGKIFSPKFSKCSYAYQSDKSAILAVETIERYVGLHPEVWVAKLDIDAFFDHVVLEQLERKLSAVIKEQDVLDLIMSQLRAPSLSKDGKLEEKMVGIYQGSSLSPLLSNIYMTEFDHIMENETDFYVRYSDDILFFARSSEEVQSIIAKVAVLLEKLGLNIQESKTHIGRLRDGINFLGYDFDHRGKAVPGKARKKLEQNLEDIWLSNPGQIIEERLKKGSQILNGWDQYYKGQKDIKNIFEYVVLVYMARDTEALQEFSQKRRSFVNSYKDIATYLVSVWEENGWKKLILLEYEQYFEIGNGEDGLSNRYLKELVKLYKELFVDETEEVWGSLLQTYSDLNMDDKSEKIMDRLRTMRHESDEKVEISGVYVSKDLEEISVTPQMVRYLMELFVGREDMYAREILTEDGKRRSEYVPEPLDGTVLRQHLSGTETIETYVVRNNDTAHYLVIDVDISRKILLELENQEAIGNYLQLALKWSVRVQACFKQIGLETYIEFSGFRGYHVWLLFSEWLPVRYIYSLIEILKGRLSDLPQEVQIEYFPGKMKRQQGSAGQKIKLPYGLHLSSGKRSFFYGHNGYPAAVPEKMLSEMKRYSVLQIKQMIAANISSAKEQNVQIKTIELDYKKLGNINDAVLQVLKECTLMRYLVNKAVTTGYLTHQERMSILYVFGHLGEAGKDFVHTVMEKTINYQYMVTQKFISRLLSKPISCIKLREQYKSITAEYGCNCVFKRTNGCYPSPVIHALKNSMGDNTGVTLPSSRTISRDKQQGIYQEMNVHVRVQELAGKIVELKRQKRGLERSVEKVEKELCSIFDSAKTDCMEVDMGLLVRRKREDGYEWLIEL